MDIEMEYLSLFTSKPMPNRSLYTENDSLEQPSELKYIPSTTSPYAEG